MYLEKRLGKFHVDFFVSFVAGEGVNIKTVFKFPDRRFETSITRF